MDLSNESDLFVLHYVYKLCINQHLEVWTAKAGSSLGLKKKLHTQPLFKVPMKRNFLIRFLKISSSKCTIPKF